MTFTFRRAIKEKTPLLVGLVGPSSSGKTNSALRLALGIQSVVGGKIAGIDTESRRMLHYAPKPGEKARPPVTFEFDHTEFSAPHNSLRYLEAIANAVNDDVRIVIVDSMSHEHEGVGGYLETHELELDRLAGEDLKKRERVNFSAWIRPARERRKLINGLLQLNANFIFCFRAKEKTVPVKDSTGKLQWVQIGWQAIAGDEFVYEMVARCLLPPNSQGTPDWSDDAMAHGTPKRIADHISILLPGRQLDEEIGRQLAQWAGGTAAAPSKAATKTQLQQINEANEAEEKMAFERAKAIKVKLLANLLEEDCFTDEERSKAADSISDIRELQKIDRWIAKAEARIAEHKKAVAK